MAPHIMAMDSTATGSVLSAHAFGQHHHCAAQAIQQVSAGGHKVLSRGRHPSWQLVNLSCFDKTKNIYNTGNFLTSRNKQAD